MANWYGAARSNYFWVKDESAFKVWATSVSLEFDTDESGRYMIHANSLSDGNWPSSRYDESTKEFEDISLSDELAIHLKDGEVVILMEAGAEKLKYVTGWAQAVSSTGDTVEVSIDDIYQKAAGVFNVPLKSITKAQY